MSTVTEKQRAALDAGRRKAQESWKLTPKRLAVLVRAREVGRRMPRSEAQKGAFKALKAMPLSERQLENLRRGRESLKGKPAWNRGLRVTNPVTIERLRASHLGQCAWNAEVRNGDRAAKLAARTVANDALRDGRLQKPALCEGCHEAPPAHAHHPDHSKPLDVVWLCKGCHETERKREYQQWVEYARKDRVAPSRREEAQER